MVSAPKSVSKPIAVILITPGPPAYSRLCKNSAMPTSVTARAPNMWLMAMRCGMAVIGTRRPIGKPMALPTTRPMMMNS